MRWPILDGGKSRRDVREARGQVERLRALMEDARQGIVLEVVRAWQVWGEARDRVGYTRIQREAADASAVVAEKAYEVGRGTAIGVQAAQREVRTARGKDLDAVYDVMTSYAEFQSAEGTLLDGLKLPEARR